MLLLYAQVSYLMGSAVVVHVVQMLRNHSDCQAVNYTSDISLAAIQCWPVERQERGGGDLFLSGGKAIALGGGGGGGAVQEMICYHGTTSSIPGSAQFSLRWGVCGVGGVPFLPSL